jgi:hypothetical protein
MIVLYCIVLYCIVLYCIVLYCIVLYCIVLYCIVLLLVEFLKQKSFMEKLSFYHSATVTMHPNAPDFIILHCLTPDDFTQEENLVIAV